MRGAIGPADARAVLAADSSTLVQLLRAIETLEQEPQERTVRVGVSSSATVDLLGVYLRRHGLLAATGIEVVPGTFDDPIGDIERFRDAGIGHVVLLPSSTACCRRSRTGWRPSRPVRSMPWKSGCARGTG